MATSDARATFSIVTQKKFQTRIGLLIEKGPKLAISTYDLFTSIPRHPIEAKSHFTSKLIRFYTIFHERPDDFVLRVLHPTCTQLCWVRLALEEKQIKYTERIVWLLENEHYEPWYLKINPGGEVPTLKVGDKFYAGADAIIDVIDGLPSDVSRKLVPDPNSAEGKTVSIWRKWLDEVPIPLLTFGVAVFPNLVPDRDTDEDDNLGAEAVRERFQNTILALEHMKTTYPELKDAYDKKISQAKRKLVEFFDRGRIEESLQEIEAMMPQIDHQILAMTRRSGLKGDGYYLCGHMFTAADISLCVLLGRFEMLGLASIYLNPHKYPSLFLYWQRVMTRPSVQKVIVDQMDEMSSINMSRNIRLYVKVSIGLILVGMAAWLGHRTFNSWGLGKFTESLR